MKKILFLIVLLYGITFVLFAELPEDNGYFSEVNRTETGGYPLYTLRNNQGIVFDLIEKTPLTDNRMKIIERITLQLGSFKNITYSKIRVVNSIDSVDCHLAVNSIKNGDKELAEFIPGGISFYYKDYLRYDTNIISKDLRVRIQGEFYSEEKLLGILDRVSSRPAEYLQMQDPEFIMRKVNELKTENRVLKQSLLAVGNKKFFKYATPVEEPVLEKLLEEKQNNPDLTVDEALEILKQAELSAKKKTVQLVFLIYFGEVTE